MSLLVIDPGLHTLVVDSGRPGARSLGVPLGGAADQFSWLLGNLLIGNPPDAPALEFSLMGPTLEALDTLGVALTGAPFDAYLDDAPAPVHRSFNVDKGQRLRIAGAKRGARGYLSVRGGFEAPTILGSRSSLEPIKSGDRLTCASSTAVARGIIVAEPVDGPVRLRALPGVQADWFDLDQFFGSPFVVNPASDRMGVRLHGEPLRFERRELVSEPVAPGAVQVVNDGQCIILGVDGQTIGGYPKIAHVIAADLDLVGQLRPGDEVRFEMSSLDEAVAAMRKRNRDWQRWATRLAL